MRSVYFYSLDDLLAFLVQCEERQLINDRAQYEFVHLGQKDNQPIYAVSYGDGMWADDHQIAPLFGGGVFDGEPDPRSYLKVHLNELLAALPLEHAPRIQGSVPALIIAAKGGPGYSTGALASQLYKIWRDIAKANEEESVFRLSLQSTPWVTVEIPATGPGFDLAKLRELPAPFKVFLPAWSGDHSCFLYVESLYRYSKAAEFALLYDETIQVPRDGVGNLIEGEPAGVDHIVLMEGEPAGPGGNGSVIASRSYMLGTPTETEEAQGDVYVEFSRSSEVYQVSVSQVRQWPEFLQSEPVGGNQLPVTLSMGRTSQSVGSLHEVDAKIGRHQRSIEELQARRSQLQQLASADYVAIFRYDQGDDQPLPRNLLHFLKRPLSELSRYRYLRTRTATEDGFEHWVISDLRTPVAQLLGTACDSLYLCHGNWWDWGLNLFLRSDASLSWPLDEPGIILKARDFVDSLQENWNSSGGYLLAEPEGGSAGAENGPISFRFLAPPPDRDVAGLDQQLFFTNEVGEGISTMLNLAVTDLEAQAQDHVLRVDESTLEAQTEITGQAGQRTEAAEEAWEEVRTRAQAIMTSARIAEAALSAAASAYGAAPRSWLNFLGQVKQVDDKLSRARIDAFGRWYAADAERASFVRRVVNHHTSIRDEVARKKAQLQELREQLDLEIQATREGLSDLEEFKLTVDNRREEYDELGEQYRDSLKDASDRLEELRKRRAHLDAELAKIRQTIADTQAEDQLAKQKERELEKLQQGLQNKQKDLDPTKRKIESLVKHIEDELERISRLGQPEPRRGFWARLFGLGK